LEDVEVVLALVRTLHEGLEIPVTCKIRVLPDEEKTIRLALAI